MPVTIHVPDKERCGPQDQSLLKIEPGFITPSRQNSCHCLPFTTGILDDEERLGQEKPTVLADLLAFASKCGDVFKLKVMDPLLH